MFLDVTDSMEVKTIAKVLSISDHVHIEVAARTSDSLSKMLEHAVENTQLRFHEALHLYRSIHKDTGKTNTVLMFLLPLMDNPREGLRLVHRVNHGTPALNAKLRQTMGSSMKGLCGMYNGYYCLDLARTDGRMCLRRLISVNEECIQEQMAKSPLGGMGRMGDTSQKVSKQEKRTIDFITCSSINDLKS
jgi:hypothetical protein